MTCVTQTHFFKKKEVDAMQGISAEKKLNRICRSSFHLTHSHCVCVCLPVCVRVCVCVCTAGCTLPSLFVACLQTLTMLPLSPLMPRLSSITATYLPIGRLGSVKQDALLGRRTLVSLSPVR